MPENSKTQIMTNRMAPTARPESQYFNRYGSDWESALKDFCKREVYIDATGNTYKKALTQYFKWLDKTGVSFDAANDDRILDFRKYLFDKRGCASTTISLYISAIRSFYQWAEDKHLCENVARGIHARCDKERVKMHLTKEQTKALLDYFESTSLRDFAMVNLMLRCGLRTIEVSRADVEDMKPSGGQQVLYIQGKGHRDKKRIVVLRDAALEPIRRYLESRGEVAAKDPLFVCEGKGSKGRRLSARRIQTVCKEGLRAIGLDSHEYSPHSLRHTAGVRIINNGGTVADVQDVLGHSSIDTSRIYLKSAQTEIRLSNPAERFLDDID